MRFSVLLYFFRLRTGITIFCNDVVTAGSRNVYISGRDRDTEQTGRLYVCLQLLIPHEERLYVFQTVLSRQRAITREIYGIIYILTPRKTRVIVEKTKPERNEVRIQFTDKLSVTHDRLFIIKRFLRRHSLTGNSCQ